MSKSYKPLKPKYPPPWGITPTLIQKHETCRGKFLDLACDLLQRVATIAAYEDEVHGKLDLAITLAEMPEELSSRAWVFLAMNQGTIGVYN